MKAIKIYLQDKGERAKFSIVDAYQLDDYTALTKNIYDSKLGRWLLVDIQSGIFIKVVDKKENASKILEEVQDKLINIRSTDFYKKLVRILEEFKK